jgi:hypothetical protein
VRVVAVDWSGSLGVAAQRRHIWTATAEGGSLCDLRGGRTRREVVDDLMAMAGAAPELVVGLDFAFSFPAWFLREQGLDTAHQLWRLVARQGESWLAGCPAPFWGRPGVRRPVLDAHLRRTEREHVPAKSVFQVGGAGAVGTGSLRGMPFLAELHDAGFSVWPFDPPCLPTVVEIYPRALTGAVRKSDPAARRRHLAGLELAPALRSLAEAGEDAFDAAVSALVMSRCEEELRRLRPSTDPETALEGEIWVPPASPRLSMESQPAGRAALDPAGSGGRRLGGDEAELVVPDVQAHGVEAR